MTKSRFVENEVARIHPLALLPGCLNSMCRLYSRLNASIARSECCRLHRKRTLSATCSARRQANDATPATV